MSDKYELIPDSTIRNKFYRIKALRNIPEIGVKVGDLGGYVANKNNLSQYGLCWIFNSAQVFDKAVVSENAIVRDNAWIYGKSKVYGEASVFGEAQIYGNAEVFEHSEVSGAVCVYDNARVHGTSQVFGTAQINREMVVNDSFVAKYAALKQCVNTVKVALFTHPVVTRDGPIGTIGPDDIVHQNKKSE